MNIAFDATAILGPMSKNRGIGNYAFDLFKTMIEGDPENEYYLLNFIEEYKFSGHLKNSDNFHEYYFYCGENNFLINDPLYKPVIGDLINNFIDQYKIDLFYITSPFEQTVLPYEKSWFLKTKVVSLVYDVIPYVLKDKYLSDKKAYQWYMECIEMLRWAERYLVISHSVKDDMVRLLHFSADKIDVIYGATSSKFIKQSFSDAEKDEIYSKFHIQSRFIMCTGGDDKRKNLESLVTAYAQMPRELIDEYQLVIVCRLSENTMRQFTEIAERYNVSGRVVCTNFVTDNELIRLYHMASLMAFPSQYEGFGLPIVEAWACGVPVLTSNNSSLGEIAGSAAILVDPFSIEDITRGLVTALKDTNLATFVEKGFQRLKEFNWIKTSDLVISARQKIVFSREKGQRTKGRIAFFTPLPPIQSGIADYSVDILNALSEYFDIDVFIDDGYQAECNLSSNISVCNHRKFHASEYGATIYQVGNSPYHAYMFSYIQKYGGILELHDENLHLVADYFSLYKLHDKGLYKKYLLEDYSEAQVKTFLRDADKLKSTEKAQEMPLNGFITNYADKIIVHSLGTKENLLRKDIHRNVGIILHYAKVEPLEESKTVKVELGINDSTIVFSSFGFIQETKRVLPSIKAFKRICAIYPYARFCLVGKPDEPTEKLLKQYLQQNDLCDKVTITGYVDLDKFRKYIDATDICINLRYPYNGETSGSLMRILAKGKCVVVNDIGSFGEIPDDCCVKLPSAEGLSEDGEVDVIYTEMERLIADPGLRQSCSENAYKYAKQHLDIHIVVKQYVDLIKTEHRPSLDENLIGSIITRLREKEHSFGQIMNLSGTLAYSKSIKNEPGTKPSDINVEDIMSKIRQSVERG